MRKITRLAALGMAAVMVMPLLTGCWKKGGANTISADDPWYNVSTIAVGDEIDSSIYDYASLDYIGEVNGEYIFRLGGTLHIPQGFDYMTDSTFEYRVDELRAYDETGSCVKTYDLMDIVRDFETPDYTYINTVTAAEDGCHILIYSNNINTGESAKYTTVVDIDAGTYGSLDPVAEPEDEFTARIVAQGGNDEGEIELGEYKLRRFWFSGDRGNSYMLVVVSPDGTYNEFDLRGIVPNLDIFDISNAIDVGNNRALIELRCSDGRQFMLLDLNTMTMNLETQDMAWLVSKSMYLTQVDGLGYVIRDVDGIYSIDYDNRTLNPVFLYSYANTNMYDIRSARPITVSEDRAVFAGSRYDPNQIYGTELNAVIYTFTRAESNPNAGKTILRIASTGDFTYPLCSAIASFNESSDTYFMVTEQKYNIDVQVSAATNQNVNGAQADNSLATDDAATSLGNQLAMDIMSGTGPDIIINGGQFGMLNDADYLLNLREYVNENYGSSDYFTNIFDAASDGDELFQVPVAFSVRGIVTDGSNVSDGQIGFTYDQYAEFVSGPCNGTDPLGQGRLQFFINSLNCMSDLVITNDTVDYDVEAFRTLAEYTRDNVNEALMTDEDDLYIPDGERVARVVEIANISTYFDAVKNGNIVFLGIPSYDGRGPIISAADTVAISAQTQAPEACREFISLLMGDDIQTLYGLMAGIPVNRSAFEIAGQKNVDARNRMREQITRIFSPEEYAQNGYNPNPMEYSVVDDFAVFVSELTGWYTNDGSINAIIREEMPAYFEGQKTLEQVIPVLEDRIQTLLNERG